MTAAYKQAVHRACETGPGRCAGKTIQKPCTLENIGKAVRKGLMDQRKVAMVLDTFLWKDSPD